MRNTSGYGGRPRHLCSSGEARAFCHGVLPGLIDSVGGDVGRLALFALAIRRVGYTRVLLRSWWLYVPKSGLVIFRLYAGGISCVGGFRVELSIALIWLWKSYPLTRS